jgi:hypothetical protein
MNTDKKTGIELIAEERREQIEKHNRTIQQDINLNTDFQLCSAAHRLLFSPQDEGLELMKETPFIPEGWNYAIWCKMVDKPYKERLIIAGALIAAEIDRLEGNKTKEEK